MTRPPPKSTLFPYPPLSRSDRREAALGVYPHVAAGPPPLEPTVAQELVHPVGLVWGDAELADRQLHDGGLRRERVQAGRDEDDVVSLRGGLAVEEDPRVVVVVEGQIRVDAEG